MLENILKHEVELLKQYPKIGTARQFIKLLKSDIAKLDKEKRQILERVDAIPDDRQRQVAQYRLIDGMKFDEIAETMFYNVKTIFRIWREVKDQWPDF